jgi:hypothetical protein
MSALTAEDAGILSCHNIKGRPAQFTDGQRRVNLPPRTGVSPAPADLASCHHPSRRRRCARNPGQFTEPRRPGQLEARPDARHDPATAQRADTRRGGAAWLMHRAVRIGVDRRRGHSRWWWRSALPHQRPPRQALHSVTNGLAPNDRHSRRTLNTVLPAGGEFATAEWHRTASSGAVIGVGAVRHRPVLHKSPARPLMPDLWELPRGVVALPRVIPAGRLVLLQDVHCPGDHEDPDDNRDCFLRPSPSRSASRPTRRTRCAPGWPASIRSAPGRAGSPLQRLEGDECCDRLVPRAERAGVAAGITGCFRGYGIDSLIPVTGPAGNGPGRGSARPGQPSFTAVPEALTISMLLPTDS